MKCPRKAGSWPTFWPAPRPHRGPGIARPPSSPLNWPPVEGLRTGFLIRVPGRTYRTGVRRPCANCRQPRPDPGGPLRRFFAAPLLVDGKDRGSFPPVQDPFGHQVVAAATIHTEFHTQFPQPRCCGRPNLGEPALRRPPMNTLRRPRNPPSSPRRRHDRVRVSPICLTPKPPQAPPTQPCC